MINHTTDIIHMPRQVCYMHVSKGDEFAKLCTDILETIYEVESHPLPLRGDGGMDIIIPAKEGERIFECKNHKKPIG